MPHTGELLPNTDETRDRLLRDRVELLQSRRGYRTSVDAMALAWYAAPHLQAGMTAVDLGAGTGLVAILLAKARPQAQLLLVEFQCDLAARAQRNLRLNGVSDRATVLVHDLAEKTPPLPQVQLVVSNPPYYLLCEGTPPQHPERKSAHCESTATLGRFAEVAAQLLAADGVFCLIYPMLPEKVIFAMQSAGLADICWSPLLHRLGDAHAVRLLATARVGRGQVTQTAPIWLHPTEAADCTYTAEIETFLANMPAMPH